MQPNKPAKTPCWRGKKNLLCHRSRHETGRRGELGHGAGGLARFPLYDEPTGVAKLSVVPDPRDREAEQRRRLDLEWVALNAFREAMQTALRSHGAVTYEQALALAKEELPEIFSADESLISRGQEPPLVREYRQEAALESSATSKKVEPAALIERDLKRVERLLEIPGEHGEIRRRLARLRRALEFFREKGYSEHQLIRRDTFQAIRPNLPRTHYEADNYSEFELPYGRRLRLRMLHPERPEYSTGADLVYEHSDERKSRARFALLQYKIWQGDAFYFSSASNFSAQLDKLNHAVCDAGYCVCEQGALRSDRPYRLPCCAAFLRLTDRLQRPDARLVSAGYHVPICVVRDTRERTRNDEKMLTRQGIHGRYLTTAVFEEMFNNGMAGSRWMSFGEVEKFYRKHHILDANERLVVYAQEYGGETGVDEDWPS
jgi:hypothetical protein